MIIDGYPKINFANFAGQFKTPQDFDFDQSYFYVLEDDNNDKWFIKEIRFVDCLMRTTVSCITGQRSDDAYEYYTYHIADCDTGVREKYRLSQYDIKNAFLSREEAEVCLHTKILEQYNTAAANFAEALAELKSVEALYGDVIDVVRDQGIEP